MSSGRFGNLTSGGALARQILLVEDDPDTAAFVKEFLERHGHRVVIAKDGGQAHSAFVMHKPDFVILDLILPGESGFEICERMKQAEEGTPILILSAIDMPDARNLARRVGADGYLTKPFDPDELLDNIAAIAELVWERMHLKNPAGSGERIRFHCRCGKKFKVSVTHKGKTLTCPECGEPLIVPAHS
jgi:DNA-binding response OmpR family regulator